MSLLPSGFRQERVCAALLLRGLPLSVARAVPTRLQESVTMNFQGTDIDGASSAVGLVLCRPIMVDLRVNWRITLVTDKAVPPARAYAMYFAVLRELMWHARKVLLSASMPAAPAVSSR